MDKKEKDVAQSGAVAEAETQPAATDSSAARPSRSSFRAFMKKDWAQTKADMAWIGRAANNVWTDAKHRVGNAWKFTKELFKDHAFWVDALAVKGGASAIGVVGVLLVSSVLTMPFLLAATGITLGVGLVGVGIFGMAAGGMKAWEGLQDIYARAMGRAPKEHVYKEKKDILQRLANTKFVKKIENTRWAKAIAKSRVWQTTQKFMRKGEDSVLGTIAVGGAAMSLVAGALALPFVLAGTLITFATVMTASTIISGLTGLYFSITGIREKSRMKREHAEQLKQNHQMLRQHIIAVPDTSAIATPKGQPPLINAFNIAGLPEAAPAAAKDAANENKPRRFWQRKKATPEQ